jgi:hypothetical protein
MNLAQIIPAAAANLGYDLDAMNDSDKVTLVRRRVVYEELVMSKDEFDAMNEKLCSDEEEFSLYGLKMKDIWFTELTDDSAEYVAFPGDVTSCTDDAISFLYENKEWTDSYEPIKIAS